MGNFMPGKILYTDVNPEGPRLNKNLTSIPNQTDNSKNILAQEQQIVKSRLAKVNDLSLGISFGEKANHSDWPEELDAQQPLIGTKTISYTMLYNIIGKRFHKCMVEAAHQNPNLADQLSDAELITTVCRKERLTFFNFLAEKGTIPPDQIRDSLNQEYAAYFKKESEREMQRQTGNQTKRTISGVGTNFKSAFQMHLE